MLALIELTAALTVESSPLSSHPSQEFNPCSRLFRKKKKHTTCAAVQTTPVGHPPIPTCHLSKDTPTTQQPSLAPLLPCPDIRNDAGDNGTTKPDSSHDSSVDSSPTSVVHTSSRFPVVGPFDLLYSIQTGGFATAWAAKDRSTGRLLCLKEFDFESPGIKTSVKMELKIFRRMAKSKGGEKGRQFLMQLNRSIQHGDFVYFAMDLATIDLDMYMHTQPERCKQLATQWMAQTALGIQSLHDMGIFHRDIKPENILIDSRENVRIIDFGMSYVNWTGKPLRQRSGYATSLLGTPAYMAPEVLRNKYLDIDQKGSYGVAVDWWALGCLLFELEAPGHKALFRNADDVQAYVAWTLSPPPPDESYEEFQCLPSVVIDLLEGLLQVQPATRFSLNDLEKHVYFLHRNGTNEFANATAQALVKPVHPELVPRFTGDDEPIRVVEAARLDSAYDWKPQMGVP